MKKRRIAAAALALLLILGLILPVFASETGTPFPFSKYADKHLEVYTAYPTWERDLRERSDPVMQQYSYRDLVTIYVKNYGINDVDEEVYNHSDNNVAKQTANISVYKVDGLFEAMEARASTNPYIQQYDIQLITDGDEVNAGAGSSTSKGLLEAWKRDAEKGFDSSSGEYGVREVTPYGDGYLYTYSFKRHDYAGEIDLRSSKYNFIRPVPEIPKLFLWFRIEFGYNLSGRNRYEYDEDAFLALENRWKDEFFNSDYIIEWKDDFRDYTDSASPTAAPANQNAGTEQQASENPGEDGGVSVPAAIVIGVLGAGAAIAGAAAAASGGSGGDGGDEDGKRSSYKMYVQKDFGNAIRRGADKPSVIRARMAEIDANGAEHDRDDLTARISVSGEGMDIESAVLSGRYVEAKARVPEEYSDDSASIVFTFTGEGGRFENKVVFRVVDGPRLKFMEETPEGYVPYHENCGINAIPGDGFTYTRLFMIEDATKTPSIEDISAVDTGEFDVSFEPTGTTAVYKMHVKNNTPEQPEHDVFAKPSEKDFEIRVNVEGESKPVVGYVGVNLYPEGITISSNDIRKKGDIKYLYVQAFEKEDAGVLDKKWRTTEMYFNLAARGENGAVIDPADAKYRFEKLKGAGGVGSRADVEDSLAEKYEYKEAFGEYNGRLLYDFEPGANLCEPEDGTFFMVKLPAVFEYGGREYRAEVPLRLVGKPLEPMGEWEQEYEKLWKRVEEFSLPGNADHWIKKVQELALDPPVAVEELRLTSKYIVREYMEYWTNESEHARDEAKYYDVIVSTLEWTKFIGDVAFSIVVTAYGGSIADALLSPAKDFLTGAIGETIAAWTHGEKLDPDKFEFSKNLAAMGDNLISNAVDFKNWRQAAVVLGCYFAYACVKNFILKLNEEDKFDLYGAIVGGFADLTSTALKAAAGHLFSMLLGKCAKFRRDFGVWCSKFVSDNMGANKLFDMRNYPDGLDSVTRAGILRKYVDGLFGMGIDKLMEMPSDIHGKIVKDSMCDFYTNADGHLMVTLWLTAFEREYEVRINLTEAFAYGVGGIYTELYVMIFGKLPSAKEVMTVPKDPKLPSAV